MGFNDCFHDQRLSLEWLRSRGKAKVIIERGAATARQSVRIRASTTAPRSSLNTVKS